MLAEVLGVNLPGEMLAKLIEVEQAAGLEGAALGAAEGAFRPAPG